MRDLATMCKMGNIERRFDLHRHTHMHPYSAYMSAGIHASTSHIYTDRKKIKMSLQNTF